MFYNVRRIGDDSCFRRTVIQVSPSSVCNNNLRGPLYSESPLTGLEVWLLQHCAVDVDVVADVNTLHVDTRFFRVQKENV